jgi:hypothetical protein
LVGTVLSVSCGSAGNCTVGGSYYDRHLRHTEPFLVNQADGTWRKAKEVPGMTALDPDGNGSVTAVSCGAVDNCNAIGFYGGTDQAFVVSETGSTWGSAQNVPGATGSTDPPLSCASATRSLASTVCGRLAAPAPPRLKSAATEGDTANTKGSLTSSASAGPASRTGPSP